jgi:hypothetical protein
MNSGINKSALNEKHINALHKNYADREGKMRAPFIKNKK